MGRLMFVSKPVAEHQAPNDYGFKEFKTEASGAAHLLTCEKAFASTRALR